MFRRLLSAAPAMRMLPRAMKPRRCLRFAAVGVAAFAAVGTAAATTAPIAQSGEVMPDIADLRERIQEIEEVSEDEDDVLTPTGIIPVVGTSLERIALQPDKDVFLLKYTSGCPACLAYRTLLEQVAIACEDVDSLVIGFYRSDLNFCNTSLYNEEELLSDPVPKLFPARAVTLGGADAEEPTAQAMEMKVSQSEAIVRWLHTHATHKFDLELVLSRLRETHEATDQELIKRFKQFSLDMCQEDAARGKLRSGSESTYYRSLCDPTNPCSDKELTWFASMMTFPARSKSHQEKEKDNTDGLVSCMDCKKGVQFEQYLNGLVEYATDQLESRTARLAKDAKKEAKDKKKSEDKGSKVE